MLRALLLIALCPTLVLPSACATWHELTPQSSGNLSLDSTRTYFLVLTDGDTLRVRHAGVVGDSVRWTEQVTHGTWVRQGGRRPVTDIRRVEVYEGSGLGTTDAEIGLGILAGLGIVLMFAGLSHMTF